MYPKRPGNDGRGTEDEFRYEVRTALGLDEFSTDFKIVERIKQLKGLEEARDRVISGR